MKWYNLFSSLRRRIVVAYLLFAIASCSFFAVVAAFAVEAIEDRILDEHLRSVAQWASPRHAANLPVDMPADVSFYHGDAIPAEFRHLPEGVQKVTVNNIGVHLLVGYDESGHFIVVDNASDYLQVEKVVRTTISIGFVGFLLISLLFGGYIARGIVQPIVELADAVKKRKGKAELPLQENHDEIGVLARAFAERTTELEQFLVRERFFTGDVSHELRTPLTVISGAAELLEAQTEGQPALAAPVKRIKRAAKDATECVTVLLLLARRPEASKAPKTNVESVIHYEIERSMPLVANKPVALRYEGGADFFVVARNELLAAAIGNLIRNACQYTEKGLVRVIGTGRSVIVEDTGPGLPEPIRARLRNEPLPTKIVGSAGSGLGLALVMRICEYLGAQLTVSDAPNGGSIFEIQFPQNLTEA
ncbi:MAG: ATP-binding protein [Burkholderiaceae bacterium]